MEEYKLYVWDGPDVLLNYGSGQVAIIAHDEAEAWDRLWLFDPSAWSLLKTRTRAFDESTSPNDFPEWVWEDYFDQGGDTPCSNDPIRPKEYALKDAPAIVAWGSE